MEENTCSDATRKYLSKYLKIRTVLEGSFPGYDDRADGQRIFISLELQSELHSPSRDIFLGTPCKYIYVLSENLL